MSNKNKKVIERLLARKAGIKDNYKIGIIFEGGGMKGQFSSGAAVGIHRLGLTDCFDVIYGSSSGSCAAAYLACGEIEKASPIYYKYLSGFRFIKPWKISKIIDIDYLCDEVFRKKIKMNTMKFRTAKPLVKIYVADAEDAKAHCFTNRDSIDYYNLVKASCAVPGFYNKEVEVGGVKALDGNAAKRLPVEEAITDGCTDILIVTTSTEGEKDSKLNYYWVVGAFLWRKLNKNFRNRYFTKIKEYNEVLEVVFGKKRLHKKVNLYTISPDYKISEAEIRSKKLKTTEQMGINKINEAFGGSK